MRWRRALSTRRLVGIGSSPVAVEPRRAGLWRRLVEIEFTQWQAKVIRASRSIFTVRQAARHGR
jgi:hypothetical protein